MIFALVHATLGWALATLAALLLRNRSADARCWAWRLGLLKGPLALALVIPVAVLPASPTPLIPPTSAEGAPVRSLEKRMIASPLGGSAERGDEKAVGGESLGVASQMEDRMRVVPYAAKSEPSDALRSVLSHTEEQTRRSALPILGEAGEAESLPGPLVRPAQTMAGLGTAAAPPTRLSLAPAASLFPLCYLLGLFTVLLARLAASRRAHRAMPRVVGVLRPRIVIPDGIAPETRAMALAHEEAHIRRRDPLWSLVADLVCAVLWFAPPVWLCARSLRTEAEAACDAEALARTGASRRDYACLLLDFAGPAPVNALGGPARRLARRILMLERPTQPLHRALSIGLLAVGLVALLPWRAVAQMSPVEPNRPMKAELPFRVPLDRAMLYEFTQPGVKAQLGWTPAQEAALWARWRRYEDVWQRYAARQEQIRRTKSLNESMHFSMNAISARERAERAAGPMPWMPAQATELKRRALVRFGGALWTDREVADRIGLTQKQRFAAVAADSEVLRRTFALLPKTPSLPRKVNDLVVWTNAKYFAAAPKDRPRYAAQIDRLVRRYRKRTIPSRDLERAILTGPQARRIRAEEDRRLVQSLDEEQRATLQSLKTDPSHWSTTAPHRAETAPPLITSSLIEKRGSRLKTSDDLTVEGQKPSDTPTASKTAKLVQTVHQPDGSAWEIYREGDGPPFRYSVKHLPPATRAERLIRTISNADGSRVNIYSDGKPGDTGPFHYSIEQVIKGKARSPMFLDYSKGSVTEALRRAILNEHKPKNTPTQP